MQFSSYLSCQTFAELCGLTTHSFWKIPAIISSSISFAHFLFLQDPSYLYVELFCMPHRSLILCSGFSILGA